MPDRPILITGAAGFIGFHVSKRLLDEGEAIVGLDNLNSYYDPKLKEARLAQLTPHPGFQFEKLDLGDRAAIASFFDRHRPRLVVHLGAQVGVRYSLQNPNAYVDSNVVGTLHILEGCRHHGVEHLVYASSSSVYGGNTKMPFSVHDNVDHPVSLYAATKKATELMAHAYSHLYGVPTSGLRFFTVYGPWGRPDMSPMLFTRQILEGKPIEVFNFGKHKRDFTYVDDVVDAVVRVLRKAPLKNPSWDSQRADPGTSSAPYRVCNVGNNQPVALMRFIEVIESAIGKKAEKKMMPMQPGDVPETAAAIDEMETEFGWRPKTSIEAGVSQLVSWYRSFYKV